jgi:hypothetical protein
MIGVFVTIISYKKGAPWPWIKFSLKTLELKITTYKSLKIIKFYFELLQIMELLLQMKYIPELA